MSEPQISLTQSPSVAPKHVAIIMDGNHRWAKRRLLPGAAGHQAGARNVRSIAELCADLGVEYLTLFAFSTENWNRPRKEIDLLMTTRGKDFMATESDSKQSVVNGLIAEGEKFT